MTSRFIEVACNRSGDIQKTQREREREGEFKFKNQLN